MKTKTYNDAIKVLEAERAKFKAKITGQYTSFYDEQKYIALTVAIQTLEQQHLNYKPDKIETEGLSEGARKHLISIGHIK